MTKLTIGEQLANSLPLSAIGEPFTIDEIDKHPDAQRIWRTIQEVCYYHEGETSDYIYTQKDMDDALDDEYDRGYIDGKYEADGDYDSGWDAGYKQGYDDCNESWKLENKGGR